jgi:2-hydroxychromene-2-carboxylate isomerase
VRWRPFLLGPIFAAQGWTTSPFNIYEAKGRYMWRDVERLAVDEGHRLVRPDPFPQNSLKAARLAVAADGETWQPSLCRAIFLAEFGEGRDISDDGVLGEIVDDLGQDTGTWLGRTQEQGVKDALRAQTEAAMAAGIFGAPSFTVGTELFWGNDRLDQALAWAAEDK